MRKKVEGLASAARDLAEKGYHLVPLMPGSKAAVDKSWTKLRLNVDQVRERWDDNPDLGVGLLLGTEVADGVYMAAIDVDTDDEVILDRVAKALPDAAPAKRGKKGITYLVRTVAPIKKVLIKKKGSPVALIEILAFGQQTVLPPSLHPKGMNYEWVGNSLHDWLPEQLPVLDEGVIEELKMIVNKADSKFFLLDDMKAAMADEPGNLHDYGSRATAAAVALGFSDDFIVERVLRAMRTADFTARFTDRDYDAERKKIEEWIKSARDRGFDEKTDDTGHEKPDVIYAKWLMHEWLGGGNLFSRSGQMLVYSDGHYSAYSPDPFFRKLAYCGNEEIMGLGHNGWKLTTSTLLAMAREFPKKPPHRRVCMKNGTVDMDTGEFIEWHRDDFLISQLPFEYDEEAQCPLYERFLNDTFAHDDVQETIRSIETFEEFVAMTLFECHEFQRFLVLEGTTRGGKSVLTKVAEMMHSPEAISSVMAHDFSNERSRTSMLGKLINITGETSTVSVVADDYMKMITAGERVDVRHLYFGAFSTVLPTRILIATNEPLKTRDGSGAIAERMLVLRCDNYVPPEKRDPNLAHKLRQEAPGIFNRLMRAWPRLRDRGKFDPPATSQRTSEQFQIDSNPVMQWFIERTHQGRRYSNAEYEYPPRMAPHTAINQLYLDFTDWSRAMGFQQMNVITFSMKLGQLKIPGLDLSSKHHRITKATDPIRVRNLTLLSDSKY